MALPYLIPVIASKVIEALIRAPSVPVDRGDAAVLQPTVERVVENEVRPTLEHLTNNEPWYQSRVTIGAIASIASAIGGIVGIQLGAEELTTLLLSAGPVIGGLITLYGRWVARKPLGA